MKNTKHILSLAVMVGITTASLSVHADKPLQEVETPVAISILAEGDGDIEIISPETDTEDIMKINIVPESEIDKDIVLINEEDSGVLKSEVEISTESEKTEGKEDLKRVAIVDRFEKKTGTISNVEESQDKSGLVLTIRDKESLYVVNVTEDTYLFGDVKFKAGMNIESFIDKGLPMTLQYPATYTPVAIRHLADNDEEVITNVDVIAFDKDLVALDKSLALNVDKTTPIENKDGTKFEGELGNKVLLVEYLGTTRSLPAQTTPSKIVVLRDIEEVEVDKDKVEVEVEVDKDKVEVDKDKVEVDKDKVEVDKDKVDDEDLDIDQELDTFELTVSNSYEKDGVVMLPLRELAEQLGFEVDWVQETKTILLNKGIYSLQIGEANVTKGKMTPITLENKTELVDSKTYVSITFFENVLGLKNIKDRI